VIVAEDVVLELLELLDVEVIGPVDQVEPVFVTVLLLVSELV
jgi:hypothetical protein